MKLSLSRPNIAACEAAVRSIVKAGSQKEHTWKPHSTDAKVLDANRQILEKLQYAIGVLEKEPKEEQEVELNRVEAKVLIATMLLTAEMQAKAKDAYAKRPDSHQSFADEPGRRKQDYVARLGARIVDVNQVLDKIRRAL